MLDDAVIAPGEQQQVVYGRTTANAVLAYKTKRKIINFRYQTKPDDVVGRMTIQALDTEMRARERSLFRPLLAFNITPPDPPKMVIYSEGGLFRQWADQVNIAHKPNVVVAPAPRNSRPEDNVEAMKRAIAAANGGLFIMSVGHGVCLNQDEGALDLAADGTMRVTGRNSDLDPKRFVSIFYDLTPPPSLGVVSRSDLENDRRSSAPEAKERLRRFAIYQDLCKAFVSGNVLAVLLLTCRIGGATGFLKRLATQFQKPIIAYKDKVAAVPQQSGKVRVILAKDLSRKDQGTNTQFGEIFFPLSVTDMIQIAP